MIAPLLLAVAAAAEPCTPFKGGPAEGMCPGTILSQDGMLQIIALLPAREAGGPIPTETATTIAAALADYDRGAPLPAALRTGDATVSFCAEMSPACQERAPLTDWRVPAGLRHNAPYLLADGRIRIEWMRGDRLALLSFVTIAANKLADIRTAPAEMPMMRR
ncbi:hypothetical protein HZY97_12345 [Sphingomonas sp. R-74633]|uniref:hypothetical protein n=1 Tax=Sphingomonas sp. R-74633 TaxID=2751188 RepID=UPI0015D44D90|nr:hypothetical protein [Sphingomonas sp. R-74633]NYT41553.1 hypothetical protein [Sphingomonas sp. R-74633]